MRKLGQLQVLVRDSVDRVMVEHSEDITYGGDAIRNASTSDTRPAGEGNIVHPKIWTSAYTTSAKNLKRDAGTAGLERQAGDTGKGVSHGRVHRKCGDAGNGNRRITGTGRRWCSRASTAVRCSTTDDCDADATRHSDSSAPRTGARWNLNHVAINRRVCRPVDDGVHIAAVAGRGGVSSSGRAHRRDR